MGFGVDGKGVHPHVFSEDDHSIGLVYQFSLDGEPNIFELEKRISVDIDNEEYYAPLRNR